MSDPKGRERGYRIVEDSVIGALLTVTLTVAGWTAKTVQAMSVELAEIKANRFTNHDGLAVWKEISSIRNEIAKLPSEAPPAWFVERVQGIEQAAFRIEAILDTQGERLARLEARIDAPAGRRPE
jgi:hypothetical protein